MYHQLPHSTVGCLEVAVHLREPSFSYVTILETVQHQQDVWDEEMVGGVTACVARAGIRWSLRRFQGLRMEIWSCVPLMQQAYSQWRDSSKVVSQWNVFSNDFCNRSIEVSDFNVKTKLCRQLFIFSQWFKMQTSGYPASCPRESIISNERSKLETWCPQSMAANRSFSVSGSKSRWQDVWIAI